MPSALDVTGDILVAATALAGLVFAFIGYVVSSYEGYEELEKNTVRAHYKARACLAFVGFVFSLLSAVMALLAKWLVQQTLALSAIALLFVALAFVLYAALSAVRKIK